jgi:hypothetical protein
MIKVYFPHGCYGTYLSQCIYNYTDLRTEPFEGLALNTDGSSHQFWSKKKALYPIITYGHIDSPECNIDADYTVLIRACSNHTLDYYNNQFYKAKLGNLLSYIREQLSEEEAEHKLSTQWNYHGKLDEHVPLWIMREWCSFWISDVCRVMYDPTKYSNVNATVELDTQDIFDNFINSFKNIVSKLNLTTTIDITTIRNQHSKFLSLQQFHNSQNRVHQYLYNLLSGCNGKIVINSIFDEAYLQHLLRQNYLEIQCDGLNEFPSTIQQLRAITYETSNHTNT